MTSSHPPGSRIDPLVGLVGKVFAFGFEGTEPDAAITRFLTRTGLATVIVFARNFTDARHLTALTHRLVEIAQRPLLVCADQEGGSVLRVRRGGSLFPSARALGRLGPEAAKASARMMGLEMRAMGLNLDLAPVLDVNHPDNPGIGIRSFGEDPHEVARMGRAFCEGLMDGGAAPTAKHFPGKGHARKDAHHELPIITRPRGELEEHEYVPFLAAFEAGCPAAMTSHCVYTALDDRPGTLSPVLLTDVLRTEMGFGGVMITDDLRMGAIVKESDPAIAAVRSFQAGADLLLICRGPEVQQRAFDLLLDAARSQKTLRRRLEESAERVDALLGWVQARPRGPDSIDTLHARHAPDVDGMVRRAIQVVRDPAGLVPLEAARSAAASGARSPGPWGVLFPDLEVLTPVEERVSGEEVLLDALVERLSAGVLRYDPKDPDALGPRLSAFLEAHENLVVFSANAVFHPAQAAFVERVTRARHRVLLVALRNPEDERLAPREATVVATYGYLPNALAAAGDVLLGGRD